MNNDILAGISGIFPFELPQNKQNAADESRPGDFLSLLQQTLNEESAGSMAGEFAGVARTCSFTGINTVNPLLTQRPRQLTPPPQKRQSSPTEDATSYIKQHDTPITSAEHDEDQVRSSNSDNDRKLENSEKSQAIDNSDHEEVAVENEPVVEETLPETDEMNLAINQTLEPLQESVSPATADSIQTETTDVSEAPAEPCVEEIAMASAVLKSDFQSLIQKLSDNLSAEEKAAIVEALQGLSQQDLAALAESPEEFKAILGELIAAMPESEAKEELSTLVESPEFMQLLTNMAEQQKATAEVSINEAEVQNASAQAEQMSGTVQHESRHVAKSPEQHAATNNTVQIEEADESTVLNQIADSAGEDKAEKTAADDNHRENKGNTNEKNVETSQNRATNEQPQNEESLRQEFKRLNQSAHEATSSSGQTESVDEPGLANKSNMQTVTAHPVTPEQAKAAVEEAARKFFSLFAEKSAGGDKATTATTYSPEAVKRHSAMSNNSAGHGSNGFSSHNGTSASSMSAARPAPPAPAASHIFSQMLEKAEYLKTENGSKILNMELDPGELGKLKMELTSRDGTVSARISAESVLAKARLEELAPQIKEQLLNQGVNLTEITVDISSKNPDERNRNQMSGNKNRSSLIQADGNDTAEAIIRKNVLPNLRRAALNIKAVDVTV